MNDENFLNGGSLGNEPETLEQEVGDYAGLDMPTAELDKPRTIVIEPMNYGYIVKLDCHKFAFESVDKALKYISEYLKDPQGTEEKWWKRELF